MDFVADQLSSGNKFRILTVVDTFTRECLAADIGILISFFDIAKNAIYTDIFTLSGLEVALSAPPLIHIQSFHSVISSLVRSPCC
ncbi:hypothetical protein DEU29_11537 [Idiomarina aquatica]|uniref:Integrase-like protein n=1 Tax=Idiomarina aquatica TaxID=1327752 RepID=A0A4R6NZF7_9GAMM|nr:hypothetical protein [Idiomarina aquatica]TDP30754.1 hypothetical protein DEU29_11537 [Idiomarina aquatica]